MKRDWVHVSAGLRLDGGGTAHLGRMVGKAMRRHAAAAGARLEGLHLPESDGCPALDGYRSFRGSRLRFSLALATEQAVRRPAWLFFDHLGPARLQGALPTRCRARFAVQLHGIEVWRELSPSVVRTLRCASCLVVNSRFTAQRAREFLPGGLETVVVHPGIEEPFAGGAPDDGLLSRAGRDFVLIVGRLAGAERYKGHDELLEAVASIAPARLVIAGDGSDRARLEAKAAALGLGPRALFAGAVDGATLVELYRRAALFAMPSRLEGFGLVFLEAMAAAKPCVALADTAPAEIVVDGETGLLVPAGDLTALARAVGELLADPERRARLGAAGRARYEREFTFEAFERRLEPVFGALAA